MAGTVAWDPFWQGGMGLAIGYAAKTGKFDPAKEPKEHRESKQPKDDRRHRLKTSDQGSGGNRDQQIREKECEGAGLGLKVRQRKDAFHGSYQRINQRSNEAPGKEQGCDGRESQFGSHLLRQW